MSKKLTIDQFIARAKKAHGERYDYSMSNYVDSKTKIKIVCSEHGPFEQAPFNHLNGMGCLLCGFKNAGQYHKKNTKSFIAEAKKVHGERYDYSLVNYKGAREKVSLKCRKHGIFEQDASSHLSGAGCEKCSYEERAENAYLSFQEFSIRAIKEHQGFYDYSLAQKNFVNASKKIGIICPKHGVFRKSPQNHLRGQGCPTCSQTNLGDQYRKSTDGFIRDAIKIHGKKYDYSETKYNGAFEGVKIICPIDGEFMQSPTSHLTGTGCPKCSRRNQGAPRNLTRALRGEFDDNRDAFVYMVSFKFPDVEKLLYKVGSGTGTRLNTVKNEIRKVGGFDFRTKQYPFKSMGQAIVFEYLAHEQVSEFKYVVPAEFKFPGYSEVFTKRPNLKTIEREPTFKRFLTGERWDPREVAKNE